MLVKRIWNNSRFIDIGRPVDQFIKPICFIIFITLLCMLSWPRFSNNYWSFHVKVGVINILNYIIVSDVYWTVHRCDNWGVEIQLDATYCFIVLLIGSTCPGCRLQPGHYSSLTSLNLHPTANQERNDQCGNQHYSRGVLMMGIVMPETCWAYKKYSKIISGILLVFYSSVT